MRRSALAALALGAMLLTVFGLIGCRFPPSGSLPISVSSQAITLEWDPPVGQLPSIQFAPFSYRVYYSQHGFRLWRLIGEVPASTAPQFSIHHSDLGDGLFDFAVTTVNFQGQESSLHTSLDSSASPAGGWHVFWVGSD
jgi:hypothetical protein